jgi:hypothetical protein
MFEPGTGDGCLEEFSKVFIQYTCIQSVSDINRKYIGLSLMSSLAIFISLAFLI